jgi:tetratricopeptide (TPR) repeat protein
LREVGLFAQGACVMALVLVLVSFASAARAQDASEARAHFEQGVAHFEEGRYDEALAEFRDAYRIRPHPSVLVNLANCYQSLGRPVEAAQHFERYLREARASLDSAATAEVQRALGAARASIGTIEIYGPAGVAVHVDGNDAGRTPLSRPVEVNPGMHVVEFRGTNGRVFTDRIQVPEGGSATAEAPIDATAPAEAPRNPLDERRPPPIEGADDLSEHDEPIEEPEPEVDGGGEFPIPVSTLIFGGVGVVSIVVGSVFGVVALGQQSDYEVLFNEWRATRPGPTRDLIALDAQDVDDARAANALIADIFLGVGAAALVAGAVIWILDATSDDDHPQIAVTPLPGGGAGSLRLSF